MVGRAWEWWRGKKPLVDAGFAAPLLLLMIPEAAGGGAGGVGGSTLMLLALFLVGPLVLRRTFPRASFTAVALVCFAQWLAQMPPIPANIAILMGLYTIAADRSFRWGLAAALVVEFGAVLAAFGYASGGVDQRFTLLMLSAFVAGTWILGLHMRTRRAYLRSLEERAARLERERDTEVQMAMAAERARIARELHDVVAHNVSVIVVQADGASFAIRTDTRRAQQALETISATGRQALAEMRRLLGVLREGDAGGPYAPQPGVDQLADLVDQVRGSGLPVSLEIEGVPEAASEGRQLTVYRIVQEALTNTLKHGGPRATATVRLRYLDGAIEVGVVDDGRGAAAVGDGRGHGLAGMRERAAVYGGEVRAGPRPGGGFEVSARVPVREEVRT
ncbi:sensor histidine kinase [Actinomadura xylanilytica]|uniref:sensor histidine kinase n=1 Tax=Actinomadura xylanilytica TaxID=887459 RepID=UPI00255B1939|nr:sensor histidine kinase [Actinomadura xylanilytica]MDL4774021.1 sensor histidine kinase [Actinomadura xylanilytica]